MDSEHRSRILVYDSIEAHYLDCLSEAVEVDIRPDLTDAEFMACIGAYDALIAGPPRRLTSRMIEQGFGLQAIGYAASRLDNVDVSAARARGIEVFNAPASSAVAIAEQTLSQLLLLASQLGDGGLAGKTLGMVGFGRIGQQVAQRARAFNMRVLVNQPRLTPELALAAGVHAVDLLELLHEADFVSLHLPFNAETQTILGQSEIGTMKPSACLINTGHAGLLDNGALLAALHNDRIAGATLFIHPGEIADTLDAATVALRQHPRVRTTPYQTTIIDSNHADAVREVCESIADLLGAEQASALLSLQVIPIEQVSPHEEVDEKRVARLMAAIGDNPHVIDPPIAVYWNNRYVILDGATRFTAFKRLGFEHLIFQLVDTMPESFTLHTWYHAISRDQPFGDLLLHLQQLDGILFETLPPDKIQAIFQDETVLCYFLARDGRITLAKTAPGAVHLAVMNDLVASYTNWGNVERTLLTDLPRLLEQFPRLTAVAIFPQFAPETVFDVASQGGFVPAGLTRFVIPGRILRLNMKLDRLLENDTLAAKRTWFKKQLAEKIASSRLRYYEEPVVLLDE
ncbi:NAD(P)-dependent oxidoreductase [Chloroflexota bacterium]